MSSHLKTNSKTMLSWFTDVFYLTLLLGFFYALWIGSNALFVPDEGRYSEVAREMIATGDYITPRVNGVVFLDKPILYYWLQASAIQMFGLKEWALRFWPAAVGILGCLATYLAGRALFTRRTGILSALILATCPLYYGAAHYANLDLEVAALISISLLGFITGIQKQRSSLIFLGYIFAGLAFLTKGLIGVFFPALIIGSWVLLLNRWSVLKKLHLFTGILLFIAITIPWYILAQKANSQFFHYFFVEQQVQRFLTKGDFNNKTPVLFYAPIVLAGIFPWTVFIFQAFYQKIKACWQNRQAHASELFLVLWALLIFVFFSIPKSKTVGYILPIFPALALLTGNYLDSLWDNVKAKGIKFGLIAFVFISEITAFLFFSAPDMKWMEVEPALTPYLWFAGILFTVAGIVIAYKIAKKKSLCSVFFTLFATAVMFLLTVIASTSAINQKSIKPLALQLKTIIQPADEMITYFKYYQDLPIYLERRITIVADWKAADIPLKDNWVREFWYGMPFQDTTAWLIDENTFWKKWNSDKRVFVLLNDNYLDQFNKNATGKVYKIGQHNYMILVSNKP